MARQNIPPTLLIAAWKRECAICGETRFQCLDLHHRDPSVKKFSLGSAGRGKSQRAILEELAKCVCLCASCHRLVHAGLVDLPEEPCD